MLNRIWSAFFIASAAYCCWLTILQPSGGYFEVTITAIFDMAKLSVEIAIGLIGILAFWLGVMKIAQAAGIVDKLAVLMRPILLRLMPDIPSHHPAMGYMSLNIAANVFGLDNAATPFGIKAMQSLQSLNPLATIASNAQIMFLVINTTSVTLFPVTVFMYRAQMGAASATDVFIPIVLATMLSTLVGVMATLLVQGRAAELLKVKSLIVIAIIFMLFSGLFWWLSNTSIEQSHLSTVANLVLLFFISYVLIRAWRLQLASYELFVEGAKEGFDIAVKIIPYLVAMLTAIGALRGSGVMDLLIVGIKTVFEYFTLPTDFVEGLSVAIMKPFSGSGSRALMIEAMQSHGADSFIGRMVSVLQGSTETTFYVLTVYFGAVGIKNIRHALAVGLIGDLAGVISAILLTYLFFA